MALLATHTLGMGRARRKTIVAKAHSLAVTAQAVLSRQGGHGVGNGRRGAVIGSMSAAVQLPVLRSAVSRGITLCAGNGQPRETARREARRPHALTFSSLTAHFL